MKKIQFAVFLFALFQFSTTQAQSALTDDKLVEIERTVALKSKDFRQALKKDPYLSKAAIRFQLDTFGIQELMRQKLDVDYSTNGMVRASYEAQKQYDVLLNKYYRILKNKLSKEDQAKLKTSQRNWIKFRDSDDALNSILAKEEYSGGGTIQRVMVASKTMDITAVRVLELYHFTCRFAD